MNKVLAILVLSATLSLSAASTLTFNEFWSLADINEYMDELIQDFPALFSREQYGTTSEGRRVEAFVIRRGAPKPTIVVECGISPREWLSTMTAMYIIHELVEHDYEFDDILNAIDIVVVPVSNPDGYVFSHTTDRNWNKNRRAVSASCFGADINRNFQYQFLSTGDPCGENFSGPFFFSEAESQSIRDVLLAHQSRVIMFVSVRGGGQRIIIPYNYLGVPSTVNEARQRNVAGQVAAALNSANGRIYTVGVGGILNGVQSGTPIDFAYELRNIPMSFELRLPSGTGAPWVIPEAQLNALLREAFRGFVAFANAAVAM
ncbi:CLUMA_CG016523, isoform A [Clunio marinus]|uniref:CLUMA_CG016523, isoform A n=1 Tax=Clunio marinus TaxID=568069 RepID=A0A1J1ITM0_9DIPT|nr:CLUMA_CG016523, isoform A [Clunio marinus]